MGQQGSQHRGWMPHKVHGFVKRRPPRWKAERRRRSDEALTGVVRSTCTVIDALAPPSTLHVHSPLCRSWRTLLKPISWHAAVEARWDEAVKPGLVAHEVRLCECGCSQCATNPCAQQAHTPHQKVQPPLVMRHACSVVTTKRYVCCGLSRAVDSLSLRV